MFGGADIGYAFPYSKYPFVVYSGLDGKVWYRDMLVTQYGWFYSLNGSKSETYYWLNLPLGILVTRPVSDEWLVGLDGKNRPDAHRKDEGERQPGRQQRHVVFSRSYTCQPDIIRLELFCPAENEQRRVHEIFALYSNVLVRKEQHGQFHDD